MTDITRADRRIVVGVEDSDAAEGALRWAVGEAEITGASVEVVYAWRRAASVPGKLPTIRVPDEEYQSAADDLLHTLVGAVQWPPTVPLVATAVEGEPDEVLASRARGASLLVVGASSGGRLLPCSPALRATPLSRRPCPLVIVASGSHSNDRSGSTVARAQLHA